jgi:uncharacterized integral membrane protein
LFLGDSSTLLLRTLLGGLDFLMAFSGGKMRHVYIILIVLLTAAVLMFKFQNLTSVTILLLGMSATLPVSTLVILVYLLGMVTGSALFGLLRSWIHGARSGRVDRTAAIVYLSTALVLPEWTCLGLIIPTLQTW